MPLVEQLRQHGFDVHVTGLASPSAWQAQLLELLPDALLLNISGSSDLGWGVRKAIWDSKLARDIPLMFYSSSQGEGVVPDVEALIKPVQVGVLARALDQQGVLSRAGQPSRTILVVDDEPNTLELHARIVRSHSASNRVLVAQSGQEALDLLAQEPVSLVLLDLQMPGIDGFTVLARGVVH